MAQNNELDREQLRAKAAEVFGLDVDPAIPTEFEDGLADARRVFKSGPAAAAIALSGMDQESLARLKTAFDPESSQEV